MSSAPVPGIAETMRLLAGAEAVAAIAADLARRLEGAEVSPVLAEHLARVVALAAPGLSEAPVLQQRAVLGAIRAVMGQARDLIERPERPPGWSYDDPRMLDEQGRISGAFGPILAAVLERVGPPAAGPRQVLDVGTGAAWLAIALAAAVPGAAVVGIDIWAPSLERARANVARAGLEGRVEIRDCDVVALPDRDRFDLAWVPGPFLPGAILAPALTRTHAALRPGGVACFGLFAGADDPLARAITDLRTARTGGHPLAPDDAAALLAEAGFRDVHEVPRAWAMPMRLVAGLR